jgi:hypothetical protein
LGAVCTYSVSANRRKSETVAKGFCFGKTMSKSINDILEKHLTDDQLEALEMICHKLARIINGDPAYSDSWRDIGGFAVLVADRLDGVVR